MSFLAPFFFAGLALLAAPWLIHRIRRPERDVIRFPSLMFVPDIKKDIIERRKIQHIMLMLLRMLLFLLLAFAFSRPYFSRSLLPAGAAEVISERHLILLDTSASMTLGQTFRAAREQVRTVLQSVPDDAEVGLVTFDRTQNLKVPLSEGGRDAVLAALDQIDASHLATHLPAALRFAEGALLSGVREDSEQHQTRFYLHLVSDFQRSGLTESQPGWRLSGQIIFRGYALEPKPVDNVSMSDFGIRALDEQNVILAGKVKNHAAEDLSDLKVSLVLNGRPADERNLTVHAGNATLVDFPLTDQNDFWGWLQVGDEDDGDNRRYFVWRAPRKQRLLLVGDPDPETNYPAPWLMGLAVGDFWSVTRCQTSDFAEQLARQTPDLVILCGLTNPSRETGSTLINYLQNGGKALLNLGSRLQAAPVNTYLFSSLNLKTGGAVFDQSQDARFEILSRVNFKHPVFLPFQGSRFNDFSQIRFHNFHLLEPGDGVRGFAWFRRNGQEHPAMVEVEVGEGRLMVWAFDIALAQTNLARNIKFLPILHESLQTLAGDEDKRQSFVTGDAYQLDRWPEAGAISDPEGNLLGASGLHFLALPGHMKAGERIVDAVNTDPRESLLETIDVDEFALKLTSGEHRSGTDVALNEVEEEIKVEYGGSFMVLLFMFVALETFYAAKLSKKPRNAGAAS